MTEKLTDEDESGQLNQNNCKLQLPAFSNVYSYQAEDQKEINGVERTVNQVDPITLQSPTQWWNAQGTLHEKLCVASHEASSRHLNREKQRHVLQAPWSKNIAVTVKGHRQVGIKQRFLLCGKSERKMERHFE
ncbi:hypothetical protein STEG23_010671 [Scotinomys teguina]